MGMADTIALALNGPRQPGISPDFNLPQSTAFDMLLDFSSSGEGKAIPCRVTGIDGLSAKEWTDLKKSMHAIVHFNQGVVTRGPVADPMLEQLIDGGEYAPAMAAYGIATAPLDALSHTLAMFASTPETLMWWNDVIASQGEMTVADLGELLQILPLPSIDNVKVSGYTLGAGLLPLAV